MIVSEEEISESDRTRIVVPLLLLLLLILRGIVVGSRIQDSNTVIRIGLDLVHKLY